MRSQSLTSHGYVGFYAAYARLAGGDPIIGIMLSQAAFLSGREADGWFEMSVQSIEDWTCLSVKQQRRSIETLVSMGVMETKEEGLCGVRHARIDFDRLDALVEELGPRSTVQKGLTGESKRASPVSPKGRMPLYKELNRSEVEGDASLSPTCSNEEQGPEQHLAQGKGMQDEPSQNEGAAPPQVPPTPPRRRKRKEFAPPTKEEWIQKAREKFPEWPRLDIEAAFNYYDVKSAPWTKGNGEPVRDWVGCINRCHSNWVSRNPGAAAEHKRRMDTQKRLQEGQEAAGIIHTPQMPAGPAKPCAALMPAGMSEEDKAFYLERAKDPTATHVGVMVELMRRGTR